MKLKDSLAFYKLKLIRSEQLPELATQALEDGLDTPSLRLLAGEFNPVMSEVGPLYENVLKELNLELPSQQEAYYAIAKYYSKQIVNSELSPYDGAKKIWWEVCMYEDCPEEFITFIGAASEIEELPSRYPNEPAIFEKYIKEYEKDIIELANKLVNIK